MSESTGALFASDPVVRRMELQDIDEIARIERECFSLPWTAAAFYTELVNNQLARYIVVEIDGEIAGYGGMWTIMDEAHITNVAVRSAFRGHGLGDLIMRHLMSIAIFYGSKRMTLEVRVSNTIAQRLYTKLGFTASGVRKGYYSDNHEDALIMWAELPQSDGS